MAAAVLTLLSLIYLGGLAALLCVAYSRRHFNRYTAVKAAVSCGFLVIAATAYLLGGHTADAYFRGLLPCFVPVSYTHLLGAAEIMPLVLPAYPHKPAWPQPDR